MGSALGGEVKRRILGDCKRNKASDREREGEGGREGGRVREGVREGGRDGGMEGG